MKPALLRFSTFTILLLSFTCIIPCSSQTTILQDSVVEVTAIRSEHGDSIAGLNDRIIVHISQLGRLQKSLNGKPLVLFMEGLPLFDSPAISVDTLRGEAQFILKRTVNTKTIWNLLLGKPKAFTKVVTVSVGLKDGTPIVCNEGNFTLIALRIWQFWIFIFSLVVTLLAIFLMYRRTDLLRCVPESTPPVGRKTYSLALSQMLFWTVLVLGAFVFIWAATGDVDTLTDSVLILMGVSSATALSARVIDTTKTNPPELSSGSYWKDILHGTTDFEPHRLQIVIWTLVLGIVFVCSVWADLTMPVFNATLLTLMGISSGLYLGFKWKE